jgi:hypothetical protein
MYGLIVDRNRLGSKRLRVATASIVKESGVPGRETCLVGWWVRSGYAMIPMRGRARKRKRSAIRTTCATDGQGWCQTDGGKTRSHVCRTPESPQTPTHSNKQKGWIYGTLDLST